MQTDLHKSSEFLVRIDATAAANDDLRNERSESPT